MSVAVVLYLGGRAVIDGTLTYGEFALFIQLLLQLVWPLESMGWIINLGQRALASAGRSFAWLESVPTLPEPDRAAAAACAGGPLGVELRDVRFAYPGGEPVLRGVDLAVAPGEVLAVCGATGAGKSTLLGLVPRFYDPTDGAVLLGGTRPARRCRSPTSTAPSALVTQRPILFSETLRDNLLGGRPDARGRVAAACEVAGVTPFVDELPDGWDTLIGERGVNLSGGQRQRVALARALLSRRAGARARRPAVGGRHPDRAARSSPGCARRSPAAPCCSPRSGSPRSRSPTASRCWRTA